MGLIEGKFEFYAQILLLKHSFIGKFATRMDSTDNEMGQVPQGIQNFAEIFGDIFNL